MPSIKYMGFSYPNHLMKVGIVLLGILFKYRTKQVNKFARQNAFYTLFATSKAKYILYRHVSYSCSDAIFTLVNVYVALPVFTCVAGTS